jgi:hypothetical protein
MENIHQVLYTIINLYMKSEAAGSLHPLVLDHIGKFTEYIWSSMLEGDIDNLEFPRTLHKIHTFIEAQQDSSKIKYFFRQGEMNTLLKDCRSGLDQALEVFKVSVAQKTNNDISATVSPSLD